MTGPDYKTKRGAAMGRYSYHAEDQQAPVKLYVRRVRLNGDYDSNGTYWGGGYGTLPLYWIASADQDVDFNVRARDREHAKAQALAKYPNARFFR